MHQHRWPYEDPARRKCVDIGPDWCIRQTVHGDDDHLAGFIVAHDVPEGGQRCEGAVTVDEHFRAERAVWTIQGSIKDGDLTLSPSIQCTVHPPAHGYIRQGKWVPA